MKRFVLQQPGSRSSRAGKRGLVRAAGAVIALFLAVLHLVTALHFSLVPHGYCAGLGGFVHLRGSEAATARASAGTPNQVRALDHAPAVGDATCCEPEHCTFAFASNSVLLPARRGVIEELTLTELQPRVLLGRQTAARAPVLLSAPKTSPPV
jgi:hypothetical protein